MDALRARWLDGHVLKERNLAPKTARAYGYGADHLSTWLGVDLWDITVGQTRRYLQESSDPPSTKALCVASIKSARRFYSLEFDVPLNGFEALQAPRIYRKKKTGLSVAVASRLLAGCWDIRQVRLVYLGLYAGLRITEASEDGILEWSDGVLVIFGKGSKVREIPVHKELAPLRETILRSHATMNSLKYWWIKLRDELGIAAKPHDLRYTFGHQLEAGDVHPHVKADLLGHAEDITTHYTGVAWSKKVAGVGAVQYTDI
jgi:integrase